MDMRQVRCFLALAETLHFGHAARRMNMTQPPFSRQIANLETDLGVILVERSSRRVELTAAGRQFREDAQQALSAFEAAGREARLVAEGRSGALKLGFMMLAAHRLIPRLVRRYTEIRPDVRLSLSEATPGEIEAQLLAGRINAALTFAGPKMPQIDSVPVFTDRLCLALPHDHPLTRLSEVTATDLSGEAIIVAPADVAAVLRTAIFDFLTSGGVVPKVGFEPRLQNTIIRLVAEGLGVGLVPASICVGETAIVTRPLNRAANLPVELQFVRGTENPALAALFDILRTEEFRNGWI
ncbi:LysR family transcriptional regulator [Martelella endophytica]|uniref:LysR family transcriptional regulator n=1 Tax=Martelella endophytica TaxID=1486262 RepID=A0A0D5LR98_MAREN|nr:LysR substrate-binding domain-containing protein [Martelella endophytica]AJY46297.1 LysR family transcriptional regulator [Martelella endophytica]